MGRDYTGPCADCYAGFSQCSLFRYFLDVLICTCMNLYVLKCTWNLYIVKCVLPSDIGSNIGSYSLAVAGMHPTREVKLYVLHIYITYISIQFLLIGGKVIHCLKFSSYNHFLPEFTSSWTICCLNPSPGDCCWRGRSQSCLHKEKPREKPFVGKPWCQVDSQCCQVVFFAKDLNTDWDLQ